MPVKATELTLTGDLRPNSGVVESILEYSVRIRTGQLIRKKSPCLSNYVVMEAVDKAPR